MSTTVAEEEVPVAPAEEAAPEKTYEFDAGFQQKVAALVLRDTIFAQKTDGLIKPEYLTNVHDQAIVAISQEFFKKYKKAPDGTSIRAMFTDALASKKIRKADAQELWDRLRQLLRVPLGDRDFVADQIAGFARHTAVEQAILDSVGALDKKDFARIEKLMQSAMNVGLHDDGDEYDYWAEIENRTEHRKALAAGTIRPDGITTGIPELDKELHHQGWGRKELSSFLGAAKAGKSMGLGDFGKNAALAGYNVLICSCEVSARIYGDRIDANLADTMMKELKLKPFDVQTKIKNIEATVTKKYLKPPVLKIHAFASGQLKPSQLRRLIERYRQRGIIFDLIIVDYADIMQPENYTGEVRHDSCSIWLDLRAIAFEQNAAVLTATQANRDGAKAATAKGTDVAEDYNKTRIADLLISINATDAEKSAGEARLFFAASRNQEGEFTLSIKQDRSRMKFITKVLGKS
jgi:replicative DNA helicase